MKSTKKILGTWLSPVKADLPPLYLVGGTVRDHLLSRPSKDIDIVCMDAKNVARLIASANRASFIPFEKKADQPCYRVAKKNQGNDFLDIAPMYGGNLDTDLNRRDFTINAIAVRINPDGSPGERIDPLNGAADIEKKCIRMTGENVFIDDPLRMLRAVRFAAILDFFIHETTINGIKKQRHLIENVAYERITSELLQIFATPNAAISMKMADKIGLLEHIFFEITAMKECRQNAYHHLDVWPHSIEVLTKCEYITTHLHEYFGDDDVQIEKNLTNKNRLALLKLGAMLHDVGKPSTQDKNEKTGRITFYGHHKTGSKIMATISERLRLSKQDQDFLYILVAEHMHALDLSASNVNSKTLTRWFKKMGDDGIALIIQSIADIMSIKGPDSSPEYMENHLQWARKSVRDYYTKVKPRIESKNFVTGKDMMKLGIVPGPEMGRILKKVRAAQDEGKIIDKASAMILAGELIKCHR